MTEKQNRINRMKINALIDMEETKIRIKLQQEKDANYRLQLLINFRQNASLRQINNQRKINRNRSCIILTGD